MDVADPIISVQNASKIYEMGAVQVAALRNCSLEIRESEFLMVVGASGSGKSTLFNLIGGMDRPTSGSVLFYGDAKGYPSGEDIARASDSRLTRYRRQEVGFVFQFFNLIPTLTAQENVQVAVEIAALGMEPIEALRLVGLHQRADHFPAQLSGGEQQRVAIARALAGNPRLLLCDEPTGALDSGATRSLMRILCRLNRELGKTVVVITHDMAVTGVADRVAVIRDGDIVDIRANVVPKDPEEIEW